MRAQRRLVGLAAAGLLLLPAAGQPPSRASLPARYQRLLFPPLTQTTAIHESALRWGGLHVQLERGRMALAAPVDGAISTAVFLGSGRLSLPAAATATRLGLAFKAAVFRFSDTAAFERRLGAGTVFTAGKAPEAEKLLRERADEVRKQGWPTIARLLAAEANARTPPLLLLSVRDGKGKWYRVEAAPSGSARVSGYEMSIAVSGHNLDAGVTLRLRGLAGRGLLLRLAAALNVVSASAAGQPVPLLRPRHASWLYLELPRAPVPGVQLRLALRYHGRPPQSDAAQAWFAQPGWYPTLWDVPARAPASFVLHLTAGRGWQVVASGSPSSPGVWRSPAPLPAAGFAVSKGTLTQRHLSLADGHSVELRVLSQPGKLEAAAIALAGSKAIDILNFLGTRFGPYAYPGLTLVTQGADATLRTPIPMLVMFSPDSLGSADPGLADYLPALQMAGQWWKASGPLDHGLRMAGGLLYEIARAGLSSSQPTLRAWRSLIRQNGENALAARAAYEVYSLRQLMRVRGALRPDADFTAALRQFNQTARHQLPSLQALQAASERHLNPALDLDHSSSLNWLFQPAASENPIPTLKLQAEAASTAHGSQGLTLTVENPEHWRGWLPIYVFRSSKAYLRGWMPITQAHQVMTVMVPFVPKYVAANYFRDMLVNVRQ
ncbi:MAG: hypothetical protein ACRD04_02055 [Terriglobales bacterium]